VGFSNKSKNKIEENDGFRYQLQISKTEFVDQQSIDHCTLQLSQLANQLNGEYDGWETVVIKN
jgi:regulator of RNase E activity RraB